MGDDDGGDPHVAHQCAQQVEQFCLNGNIQAAGGFIHEDETRLGHQDAGDLQTLLHASGEMLRQVVDAIRINFDARQPVTGDAPDLAIIALARVHQALADIATSRNAHAQTVAGVLMHDAPGAPHEGAAFGLGQGGHIQPLTIIGELDLTAGRLIKRRQAAQQGRFSRAGLADNAENFARPQLKRDGAAADAFAIVTAHILHLQERLRGHGLRVDAHIHHAPSPRLAASARLSSQ